MESDIELLNAARRMNQDALVKIFDLYAPPLYRYALRLCDDPPRADQMVGDVFTKLLEQFAAGSGPKVNLRSYLYQLIYQRMIDEASSAPRSAPLEAPVSSAQDAHAAGSRAEDQIMLKHILHVIRNELTDDQRHVISLRLLEEFSLGETAAIIGKKVNHIKVIQSRALEKLRKGFQNHGMRSAP